jgi:hypothetical protein
MPAGPQQILPGVVSVSFSVPAEWPRFVDGDSRLGGVGCVCIYLKWGLDEQNQAENRQKASRNRQK